MLSAEGDHVQVSVALPYHSIKNIKATLNGSYLEVACDRAERSLVAVAVESEVRVTSLKPLMSRAVGAILDCLKDGTKWELHHARGTTLTTFM
jgi:hypothetical protein